MSLFSFNSNQAAPSGSTGFGNTGAAAPAPTNSFSFGASTQPQQQQQPQAPGSSLFGGNQGTMNQPQAGSTSLFGGNNQVAGSSNTGTTGGGLFGQQSTNQPQGQAGTSLFGQPTQNAQQPQQQTGTGLGTGGGLFGSTNQQPQQPQQQQGGSNMFGQPQQQQQQPPPQQRMSLFGNNTGGAGGLNFGQPQQPQQQQQQQQQGGSLFSGLQSQNQHPQQQQQQSTNFFGQSQMQNQNQTQNQNQLFGSTNNNSNTGNNNALQQSYMSSYGLGQSMIKQEVSIEERMNNVQKAWDENSLECRFKYFFYNVVETGTAPRYGRPPNATDDAKWAKADRENPDPESMVPVLATGWTSLQKRVSMQEQIAAIHQEKIKEISLALSHLTRQTSLSSSIRLSSLQNSLNHLMTRLIHLASLTPGLIPILQSTGYRPEEAETKASLERTKAELEGRKISRGGISNGSVGLGTPKKGVVGGEGRMIGQVNELWGQVEEIRRYKSRMGGNGGGDGREGWLGDEKALAEVAEILATQQLALQKLTELVNTAMFDADVMRQGLGSFGGRDR